MPLKNFGLKEEHVLERGRLSEGTAYIKKLFSCTHSAVVEASKVIDKVAIETGFSCILNILESEGRGKGLTCEGRLFDIGEFMKRRRRRRGQLQKKVNLHFTYESHDTQISFSLFFTVKTILKLSMEHSVKLEIEI